MERTATDGEGRTDQEYREAAYAAIEAALAIAQTQKDYETIMAQCGTIAGYRDADQILEEARQRLADLADKPDLDEVFEQRLRRWAKRRKTAAAWLVVLAVAGALAGMAVNMRRDAKRERFQDALARYRGILERYAEDETRDARSKFALGEYDGALDRLDHARRRAGERQRQDEAAQAERMKAEEARSAAVENRAAVEAKELFHRATRAAARAVDAYELGDFAVAGTAWREAAASFVEASTEAGKRARGQQDYAEAKSAYETALEPERALLREHGGLKWQKVLKLSVVAAQAELAPAAGAKVYTRALAGLRDATSEARRKLAEETERTEAGEARTAAAEARTTAAEARKAAAEAGAAVDARVLFDAATQTATRADSAYGSGDYAKARGAWRGAASSFVQAGQRALAVQACAKAKATYETMLGSDEALLREHGGREWQELLRLSRIGMTKGNPAAGSQAYARALAELPKAVSQARQRQHETAVNAALSKARSAKSRSDWSGVVACADQVLTLDAGNQEASALKREATTSLTPTCWKLAASLGGHEVPATATVGTNTFALPHTMTLKEGECYTARFTYEAEGKYYRAKPVTVTADWKGERECRAELEEARGPVPGKDTKVEDLDLALVWIDPGSFQMGSGDGNSNEKPVHMVQIAKGFWLGKYEVTQAEYRGVTGTNPSRFQTGNAARKGLFGFGKQVRKPSMLTHPVEQVSWNDAAEFCRKLTQRERAADRLPDGYVFRLPTEAEWEYACRAGTMTTYSWGNSFGKGNCNAENYKGGNGKQRAYLKRTKLPVDSTMPVGTFAANAWGLHDMHGNVQEWCFDWYEQGSYKRSPATDPVNTTATAQRVMRGGFFGSPVTVVRSASRGMFKPTGPGNGLGFRACLALPAPIQTSAIPVDDEEQLVGMSTGGERGGSDAATGPTESQPWRVPRLGMELVWVASGQFVMGSSEAERRAAATPNGSMALYGDETQHPVKLPKGFWLGKYEVTQAEYEGITGKNPSTIGGDRKPVEQVSWDDAMTFCQRLSEREQAAGRLPKWCEYRLPTEAEWEYAARGGARSKGFRYSGSDRVDEVAWHSGNADGATHPVGRNSANELGLFDMGGNVWEWCMDWYGRYPPAGATDPRGAADGSQRVFRGGSWRRDASHCRSAYRSGSEPKNAADHVGFRVALAVPVR